MPVGNQTQAVQPVASYYNDRAVKIIGETEPNEGTRHLYTSNFKHKINVPQKCKQMFKSSHATHFQIHTYRDLLLVI
jgi:hypothetical protein